jgi:hypothetical protein
MPVVEGVAHARKGGIHPVESNRFLRWKKEIEYSRYFISLQWGLVHY